MKLKLADLVISLSDAKMSLAEIQETLTERDKKIQELEEAFESKDSLVKRYDAYYLMDQTGKPTGEPYCASCWEVKHKKYHLYEKRGTGKICVACKTVYSPHATDVIR